MIIANTMFSIKECPAKNKKGIPIIIKGIKGFSAIKKDFTTVNKLTFTLRDKTIIFIITVIIFAQTKDTATPYQPYFAPIYRLENVNIADTTLI